MFDFNFFAQFKIRKNDKDRSEQDGAGRGRQPNGLICSLHLNNSKISQYNKKKKNMTNIA